MDLEGTDQTFFTQDSDPILDETERFLTGTTRRAEPDRILATVMFTDIVESTARAAALGDRAGLHTGECEAIGDDVGGLSVHIGARVAAKAGEVVVSSTVCDLVIGSGLDFVDRVGHELKGVPGIWRLGALRGQEARPSVEPATEHMTLADRATVGVARRAPGLLRALGRRSMRESA